MYERAVRWGLAALTTLLLATSTGCDVGSEPEVCLPPVSQQALSYAPTLFVTVASAATQRFVCDDDVDPCADNSQVCAAVRDGEEIGTRATLDLLLENRDPVPVLISSLTIENSRCSAAENESQFSIVAPWLGTDIVEANATERVQIQFDRIAPGACDAVFAIESDAVNLEQPSGEKTFRIQLRFLGRSEG